MDWIHILAVAILLIAGVVIYKNKKSQEE